MYMKSNLYCLQPFNSGSNKKLELVYYVVLYDKISFKNSVTSFTNLLLRLFLSFNYRINELCGLGIH